jgi:hypothetical protein
MAELHKKNREELLRHYASKEIHTYLQLDCFVGACDDAVTNPDKDEDALFASVVDELRSGGPAIRIQVPEGTSKIDTIRAVRKLLVWIEEQYYLLWEAGPHIWTESLEELNARDTETLQEFYVLLQQHLNAPYIEKNFEQVPDEVYARWEESARHVETILTHRLGCEEFERRFP